MPINFFRAGKICDEEKTEEIQSGREADNTCVDVFETGLNKN
jgi:hypothetical protein